MIDDYIEKWIIKAVNDLKVKPRIFYLRKLANGENYKDTPNNITHIGAK